MEETQIAIIGSFCLNEGCEDYQKVNHGNMIKHGKTDTGVQRYRCKTCKKAFVETKGTMFYRLRHSELVRKTLLFSKDLLLLKAASALEDALYNFTRPLKTLRVELEEPTEQARWQQRTPAMAASLTDHIWTVKELLHLVLVPFITNN